jgi:hypothetical protein
MTAPLLQSEETGIGAPRRGGVIPTMRVLDEPARLIDDEAVEVERESPAKENEPVERPRPEDAGPPAFEDEEQSK